MKTAPTFAAETEMLEGMVRAREPHAFRAAVRAFLRRHRRHHPDALFLACDWFRRLGQHEQAYRLVDLREPLKRRTSTSDFEGKRVLWAARLLTLMGATGFALPLLDQIAPETFDDHRIMGGIYLAHFDHARALGYLERLAQLDREPASYRSRIARVVRADALAGLGRWDEALELVARVRAESTEPLVQGIALQAEGEYLARAGRLAPALASLRAASAHFAPNDESADHAYLLKWLGFALARAGGAGGREEGRLLLERAFTLIRANRMRPEAWLDVERLRVEAGLAPSERLELIRRYPGLAPGFSRLLGENPESTPNASSPASRAPGTLIDLARDEYRRDGDWRLGVPLELRMVAYAALAGEWGIPLMTLQVLLWPDEVYSFLQLENRLFQLVHRARHVHGIELEVREASLLLAPRECARILVPVVPVPPLLDGEPLPPSLLEEHARFSRRDVESRYGISRTQAATRIAEWEARGWVRRAQREKRVVYEVCERISKKRGDRGSAKKIID